MSAQKRKCPNSGNWIEVISHSTQIKKRAYRLEWEIDNFNFACDNFKTVRSLPFTSVNENTSQWVLQIEKVIPTYFDNNDIHFNLTNLNAGMQKKVYYSFSLKSHSCESKIIIFKGKAENNKGHWIGSMLSRDLGLSKFDIFQPCKVTITCDLWVIDSLENLQKETTFKYEGDKDFEQKKNSVFEMDEFKDFFFTVQDKKFGVHKIILAIESPVFAAMFQTNMQESLTSSATLNDVKPQTFEKMLQFIYDKEISKNDLKASACDLLCLAHKYEIKKLEQVCTQFLCQELSAQNAAEVLNIAKLYGNTELMDRALKFAKV